MIRFARITGMIFGLTIYLYVGVVWADKPLTIVTDPWPPYVVNENNDVNGTDVEIITAVFNMLGLTATVDILPWKRCLVMVKHKKADAILDVAITDERKEFLYFPNEPVSEGVTVFFIRKGRTVPYTKLDDLNRFKAGAMLGYQYCDEIDQSLFAINARRVSSLEQNFKKLLADRIDFIIEVDAVGYYKAKNLGISDQITIIPNATYCHGGNYLAFAKKPGYKQMAEKFGSALKAFKATDEYNQIITKYGRYLP